MVWVLDRPSRDLQGGQLTNPLLLRLCGWLSSFVGEEGQTDHKKGCQNLGAVLFLSSSHRRMRPAPLCKSAESVRIWVEMGLPV